MENATDIRGVENLEQVFLVLDAVTHLAVFCAAKTLTQPGDVDLAFTVIRARLRQVYSEGDIENIVEPLQDATLKLKRVLDAGGES